MSSSSKPFPDWSWWFAYDYERLTKLRRDHILELNEKCQANLRQAKRLWDLLKYPLRLPEQMGFNMDTGELICLPTTEAGKQLKEEIERFWCS